jgi:hypothetical protein
MEFNETKREEISYTHDPGIYFERVIAIQREKIDRQTEMLSRLQRVYDQKVESCSAREALGFAIKVIINKIKQFYGRISNV